MTVYCAVHGEHFALVAIFGNLDDATEYVRRTTEDGAKVFAHLHDFRVIAQEISWSPEPVVAETISVANYHAKSAENAP